MKQLQEIETEFMPINNIRIVSRLQNFLENKTRFYLSGLYSKSVMSGIKVKGKSGDDFINLDFYIIDKGEKVGNILPEKVIKRIIRILLQSMEQEDKKVLVYDNEKILYFLLRNGDYDPVDITKLKIFNVELKRRFFDDENIKFYFAINDVEKVLDHSSCEGIKIDKFKIIKLKIEFEKEKNNLENKISEIVGAKINLNGAIELSKYYESKEISKVLSKTKLGYFSLTRTSFISLDAAGCPIAKLILLWRELDTKLTKFIYPYMVYLENELESCYPQYNIIGAISGRTSTLLPNIQGYSKDGKTRGIFIPQNPNNYFLSLDYSELEIRIFAYITENKNIINLLESERRFTFIYSKENLRK